MTESNDIAKNASRNAKLIVAEQTPRNGILYLCATPIGNLEDMTFRAVRVLKEAAVIAAEDTRHTRKLLSHFELHTPLISYHEHNKASRGPELVNRLLGGEDVAVVSDAGIPGISDPGADLVRLALAAGITVVPLPGACAALTGLVASGQDSAQFVFLGFLPKTAKKRREVLARVARYPETLVLYESPHHLKSTLAELAAVLGDRPAVAARELTKKFEEFHRGSLISLHGTFSGQPIRGEFVLIVAGAGEMTETAVKSETNEGLSPAEQVATRVAAGQEKKEAIRLVAQQLGIPKRQVYQAFLDYGSDNEDSAEK
ncbi:MAG TPA: 16S rRNA (cytidine(1402)-2'-O)-methyltransferase [Patescibacteria group bacterium]|nr:16S rRNA (cytidine(1402)-2'-O)-methyltransferase [Patescibacteria group bacterium]